MVLLLLLQDWLFSEYSLFTNIHNFSDEISLNTFVFILLNRINNGYIVMTTRM